jgi:glutamine amidotransferase
MGKETTGIVIVDYGMGNLGSIANMIKKVGGTAKSSADPAEIGQARKLILPGVGAFDAGMTALRDRGLIDVLNRKALEEKVPVLGICLGMQLLSRKSEEGVLPGLGWIPADTRRFQFGGRQSHLRIPHMGWNAVEPRKDAPLFGSPDGPWRFYFVHSYHVCCSDPADVLSTTPYGSPFTSGVARGNILGVQFHPEKSHAFGMRLFRSFLEL